MTGDEFAIIADGIGATSRDIADRAGVTYRTVHRARVAGSETIPSSVESVVLDMETSFVSAVVDGLAPLVESGACGITEVQARMATWIRRFRKA